MVKMVTSSPKQGEGILSKRDCFASQRVETLAMTKMIVILFFGIISLNSVAQVEAFATAKLNRKEVFPEQPIKATITVSTATWFTK